MNQKYRNTIMWVLFALLYLLVLLLQTVVLGRARILGVTPNLMPVVVVCIAMHLNHEAGGLFGLIVGFVWYAAGGDDGILAMVSFPVFAILAGWLCDNLFSRRIWSALLLSLSALLCHETAVFLLKFYLAGAEGSFLYRVPLITAVSLPACPAIYLLAKAIRKAGAPA